ncbi:cytochrome c3 family protein [Geobacter sp. FeAm09]|nr:cytochrome c3 family protein [Geobacter sp. FeAm09]
MALIEEKTVSWAGSAHLDAIHAKSNVGCGACHGKGLPEKGAEVANERCLACHGSYEELAAKTTSAKPPVRNPHKSHLGEIGCTVCHRAHDVSEAYCNGCHAKINMKIPGGK